MTRLPGRLGELCARDVMTPNVVTVRDTDTLAATIHSLKQAHVTGAPVVDADGQLRGIFSIRDLVKQGDMPGASAQTSSPQAGMEPAGAHASWHLYDALPLLANRPEEQPVGEVMSPNVVSVQEESPLVEVARTMCDGHLHRVPVITNGGILCGIISTMDVLAAVVNVADEPL